MKLFSLSAEEIDQPCNDYFVIKDIVDRLRRLHECNE